MSSAPWSLHLLGEVLSAFAVDSPTALRDVVSRVAEAVDAEISAILGPGGFSLCTGLTAEEKPQLLALQPDRGDRLELAGNLYHLYWAPLGRDELLVVGRARQPFDLEERALLRGMGRSVELSTRVLAAVRAQKEALEAEQRAKEAAIREATIDPLTGLPNRRLLLRHLSERLSRPTDGDHCLAVLFIDLDRFKQINDLHGHRAGDAVLRMVATHLRTLSRASDVVGRISGDEFLMICALSDPADAERLALRILEGLLVPIQSQGMVFASAASVGIAIAEAGDTPDDLIDNADMAMYAAKQQGRGRIVVYARRMRDQVAERHRLQEELRQGLAAHQLEAWLQPIVSAAHGAVVGFEALVRWRHPVQGLLTPDRFLAVAEEAGLLRDLDAAVLEDAIRRISRWATSRDGILPRLSVNVSAISLADPRLIERVEGVLESSGFPSDNLFLEITETTLVEDVASATANIAALERLGIRLAIDDFGTGYSSLSRLHNTPLHALKVDGSFVRRLDDAEKPSNNLLELMQQMGRDLGLHTTAEGIETEGQRTWLSQHGFDWGQGYLFARPMDLEAFIAYLKEQHHSTTACISRP